MASRPAAVPAIRPSGSVTARLQTATKRWLARRPPGLRANTLASCEVKLRPALNKPKVLLAKAKMASSRTASGYRAKAPFWNCMASTIATPVSASGQ